MSQKGVVLRSSGNNRRKNTDGYRTDSGCFEDVDVLQMFGRNNQNNDKLLVKNTATSVEQLDEKFSEIRKEDDHLTGGAEVAREAPSSVDECVDDAEFRAILERLGELTKNPGDLYRLCFSSRLSFCGLSLGVADEKSVESVPQPGETVSPASDLGILNRNERTEISTKGQSTLQENRVILPREGKNEQIEHKNCGNREQCVELLSLLSSFVEKANESPAIFSQSGLGRNLLGQLSSLLTTLEEAKKTTNVSKLNSKLPDIQNEHLHRCPQLNFSGEPDSLQSTTPTGYHNHSSPQLSEFLSPEGDRFGESIKESEVQLASNYAKPPETLTDGVTGSTITPDHVDAKPQSQDQDSKLTEPPGVDSPEDASVVNSEKDSSDVVLNGRRAVKPYSWDYGDIWEKELQRAQSTDSFQSNNSGGNIPGGQLLPSFEKIRDELFHDAGFIVEDGSRTDGPKRRSRSADARSNLEKDSYWGGSFGSEEDRMHSPFVRTVYQQGSYSTRGLTRSRSSHLLGGDSITVNIDQKQGRQVRLFSENCDDVSGFRDSWARMIKEAVVETSTFRGQKPWATLKRRPSGLRRRAHSATRAEPRCLQETDVSVGFARIRLDSHGDSESSDSPYYVSTASSDCLTTDDCSSVTSSHYLAASSLQSSPCVSNRNSACFSDAGSSDLSDLRRVVFQDSSPESCSREKYPGAPSTRPDRLIVNNMNAPAEKWRISLDQRFASMNSSRIFCQPDEHRIRITANNLLRTSNGRSEKFRNSDPLRLLDIPYDKPRNWPAERVTPLLVRSDSDLNRLTKVHFIGESYSRSRLSKNLRGSRKFVSPTWSPGPRAAHTRVVSCEIVPSDNDKPDVYTKVNLSRTTCDDDTASDGYLSPWTGRTSTRRSWHGHSPSRGFTCSTQAHMNSSSTRRVNSERYTCPSGLVDRRRQVFGTHTSGQTSKPVHAKLVEVKGDRIRLRNPSSTRGSSEAGISNQWPRSSYDHGYSAIRHDKSRQFPRNVVANRRGNFERAQAVFNRTTNPGIVSGRRRLPRDQPTATNSYRSVPSTRQEKVPNAQFYSNTAEGGYPVDRRLVRMNGDKEFSKEPVTHIVKETSFVGPSTFTKYQSPSSPSLARSRRSKSFNEKDSSSQRCLEDFYRRRAVETSHGNANHDLANNQPPASGSEIVVVRRPERRRRFSEEGWRPSRTDSAPPSYVVDESYCDPRRESIREGTYSIVSAESARNGTKSEEIHQGITSSNDDNKKADSPVIEAKKIDFKITCVGQGDENPEKRSSNVVHELAEKDSGSNEPQQANSFLPKESLASEASCIKVEVTKENEDGELSNLPPNDTGDSSASGIRNPAGGSSGVNICIDYRNKKPVSVEYCADTTAKTRPEDSLRKPKFIQKEKNCAVLEDIIMTNTTKNTEETPLPASMVDVGGSSEESTEDGFPRKRLSRRDRHEREVLASFGQRSSKDKENKDTKPVEVTPEQSSPVPYCRDKSIVYVDARSSLDSDTDSISHDSTISSSGSDMTVVLNDDTDISAGNLRQLAQSSSEIGIEIGSLEVDSSDDLLDNSDSSPEKGRPKVTDWSTTPKDKARYSSFKNTTDGDRVSIGRAASSDQSPGYSRRAVSNFSKSDNNQTLILQPPEADKDWRSSSSLRRQNISENALSIAKQKSGDSPVSSVASSRESSLGSGTSSSESCKGKHFSGKNGESGKGFFSRLKSIRNSLRGKKVDGKTSEKSGKKSSSSSKSAEKNEVAPELDIRGALGSRSLPIIDSNSNEMHQRASGMGKYAQRHSSSSDYCTKIVRKEVVTVKGDGRHDDLRRVVGVKSVSSDHLNSFRVNRPSFREVSAKSLEVLVETCI